MTRRSKSGGETSKKHVSNTSLEDHLGEKFETIGGKEKWEGQEIEVQSDPLEDGGTGKPIIMRFFEFKANPETFKVSQPSNQELFNAHAHQIQTFLWKDGLVPLDYMSPKLIFSKKRDGYRIMVACEPRLGVALAESPQTLQQILNPHGRK